MVFDRSTQWFNENTCSTRAEDPKSPFFRARQCSQRWRSKDLPVWPLYCRCQHPVHGTLYTSTLLWLAGTGSLGCTTSCHRVVKGWKVSQRSTGLTWSRRVCRSGCSQVYACMNPFYLIVVCWYWVLGVHYLLPQGCEGMEGDLDGWVGRGGDPMDGFGQSTNVGESQRSTGLTWSRRVCRSGCSQVYACMNPVCLLR